MSVFKKIALIMQDVHYLKKDDDIEFGKTKYKAISEEKVTTAVRESMVKHGLVIIPIKQEHKKVDNLSTVDVTYKIVDVDTGDSIEAVSSGTGVDTQDKGVGKAMTYAYKYLLLRTFAIPTGEDPDKISSAEWDAKQTKEQPKEDPNDKQQIITVLSKWEALGSDKVAFQSWVTAKYQKGIEELTIGEIKAIDQSLTKKLLEKKKGA